MSIDKGMNLKERETRAINLVGKLVGPMAKDTEGERDHEREERWRKE